MPDRWATFDCYGTLIDWLGGIRGTLADLWPDADPEALSARYHLIEPTVQAGRGIPYRTVMSEGLARLADDEGLVIPAGREDALGVSMPSWPRTSRPSRQRRRWRASRPRCSRRRCRTSSKPRATPPKNAPPTEFAPKSFKAMFTFIPSDKPGKEEGLGVYRITSGNGLLTAVTLGRAAGLSVSALD